MYKFTILFGSLFVSLVMLSGCGTSPDSRFYTLNAIDKPEITIDNTPNSNVLVKVGPITIPDTIDQSQIVTRSGSNILVLNEFNRWGGDIQDDFRRILGENISVMLPTDQVILDQEMSFTPVDFQVVVNVREFLGELGGIVTLNADWVVVKFGKEKSVISKKSVLQETATLADYQTYVAIQSRLWAKLSQQISDEIKAQLQQ